MLSKFGPRRPHLKRSNGAPNLFCLLTSRVSLAVRHKIEKELRVVLVTTHSDCVSKYSDILGLNTFQRFLKENAFKGTSCLA